MNYNNLPIGKKLALVFSMIACAIIGLGLFLVSELQHVRDNFIEFADLTVPSVSLVNEIELEAAKIRVDQWANIAQMDSGASEADIQQWVRDGDRMTANIDKLLADYEASLFSGEETQVFKQVAQAWKRLQQSQASYGQLMIQSEGKAATRLIADTFGEYELFTENLEKLAKVNSNFIKIDRNATLERVNASTNFTYFGIAATAIFMILMDIFLTKKICNPMIEVMKLAKEISSGNLAYQMQRDKIGNDELGQLADSCIDMQTNLCSLVENINVSVVQLSSAIEEVSAISEQSSQGMSQQQNEITLIATAMHQMQMTVNEVARNTEDASSSATEATKDAELGSQDIQRSIVSIQQVSEVIEDAGNMVNKLEENSTSIGMVVDVIRGIADQTNLLALNAAIEAARAGEQGRGFAVVADEVRTLAGRTQSSTNEIVEIIENLQLQASKAGVATKQSCEMIRNCVTQSQQTGEKISAIECAIGKIASMNTQIASACSEQNSVTEDLNRNVTNINLSSTEVSTGSQHTAQACIEISQLSVGLQTTMAQFKVA
ncbi:MAG: methyl-accepting chemotaxis protein [Moritella sp.]|uniref:methyl-accepting chemotaxis protein n=1 Tax=Moritella sp. TaxID=78556 RepID=UPI0029A0DFA4|nr:methyl-accepting chemotaxis protein [Moritella sp.]MDX2321633.1 methyl-accepting chemotaxis protein [Moritella sp.]